MNPRRLYRCRHDRQLAGVAAGMAEYLDLDPTLVRVLWVVSAFFGGITILIYIILAFVMPLEPATMAAPGPWPTAGAATVEPQTAEAPGTSAGPDAGPTVDGGAMSGWTPPHAWVASHAHELPDTRRRGRIGLFLGVLLVVFGAIALVDAMVPAWAAAGLMWPAFVLAVGAALLISSIHRPASEP